MLKLKLHWQILIALVLAGIAGSLVSESTRVLGVPVSLSLIYMLVARWATAGRSWLIRRS